VFPQYSDLLSTPLPWLYALAIGLLPAAAEELLFRLGGITLLRRATGMPRLAVVVTAVVWAALHATYAQQPFYIRVLELSLVGVVFGALFLRYGILASVAAHYTYNAAVSLPLLINGDWGARAGAAFAVGACLLLLLPALVRKMRGGRLEDKSAEEKAPVGSDGALWSPPMPVQRVRLHSLWGAHEPLAPMLLPLGSSHRSRWLAVPVGLAALALALVLVPLPPVLDRPLTRDEALARGVAAAAELDQPGDGLYGAAWPLDSLVNLDTRYLADHPGAQDPAEVAAREGLRASWYVRLSAWDRDDPLALWLDAEGRVLAFQRTLPEDAPGATLARPEALARAEELLRGQGVDPAVWELVDTATITRPLRVDHSFTWEHAAPLGEAGRPRVTVGVQGERVGLLSRHHFTPPEYRREREQTTLTTTLAQSLPALPALAGLALSAAALLLALRRPLPLHAMVAVGLTGGLAALLANLLRLAPADLAEPQRLIQSMSSAAYWAILAGSELALAYGCAAALRGKTTDHRPATTDHRPATTGGWWPPVGGLPLSLGLAALPALLTIEALNLGLTSLPGAALTPEGAGSWLPTLALLLQSGFDALRAALLLAGSAALIGTWRPLRTLAWPLVTLGAALAAVAPETTQGLLVVLPAWGLALLAAWALRGSLPALLLVLWLAAALPDALMLAMMSHPWHGLAGWAAIALLVGTVLALAARPAKGLPARPAAPPPPQG
jgi:membrane protease YdiL (CAAX protease family)